MNYTFIDRFDNTWIIGIGVPKPTLAVHKGELVYGWWVRIISPTNASVEHQHPNLAEAVAQAIAKADWMRK